MIEDCGHEEDTIAALMRVVEEHGSQAIAMFALTRLLNGQPKLFVMHDDLVLRIEQEMERRTARRRAS